MSSEYRKPDQIIQPYQFGHRESKKTCLWLHGLPKLTPTKIVEPVWFTNPTHYLTGRNQLARWENQTPSGRNKLGPSPDRAQDSLAHLPRYRRRHGAAVERSKWFYS